MPLRNLQITNHTQFDIPETNTTGTSLSNNTLSRAALITVEVHPDIYVGEGCGGNPLDDPWLDWNIANTPSISPGTGEPCGLYTICHRNLTISGYSGIDEWYDGNPVEGQGPQGAANPLYNTVFYNGPDATQELHPFAFNRSWSPYSVQGFDGESLFGSTSVRVFYEEQTKTYGNQSSLNLYNQDLSCNPLLQTPAGGFVNVGCLQSGVWNPDSSQGAPYWGGMDGTLVGSGDGAVDLWDDRVEKILMFNTNAISEAPDSANNGLDPCIDPDSEQADTGAYNPVCGDYWSGWYGEPGNKVYVVVILKDEQSITADTSTIEVDINGMPRYHWDY